MITMVLEVDVNPESVKKLEKFLGTGKYKDLAVNTQSFSRKLKDNEKNMKIEQLMNLISVDERPLVEPPVVAAALQGKIVDDMSS